MEDREPPGDDPDMGPAPLPRGRHGLPRELIRSNQRERLIGGVIATVAESDYSLVTIAAITKRAHLSKRTFYEHFANKEDCFAAAYEVAVDYIAAVTLAAAKDRADWAGRIRAWLAALLEDLAAHGDLARFLFIAPSSAGGEIAARQHVAMRRLICDLVGRPPAPSKEVEESQANELALAGGVTRLIVARINAEGPERLPELLPALVELVARSYLGTEEAVRLAGEISS